MFCFVFATPAHALRNAASGGLPRVSRNPVSRRFRASYAFVYRFTVYRVMSERLMMPTITSPFMTGAFFR